MNNELSIWGSNGQRITTTYSAKKAKRITYTLLYIYNGNKDDIKCHQLPTVVLHHNNIIRKKENGNLAKYNNIKITKQSPLILIIRQDSTLAKRILLCIMKVCSALNLHLVKQ